jgi:hypothetical protein
VRCHAEVGEVDCLGVAGHRSGGDRPGWADRGDDPDDWGYPGDWGGGPTADAQVTDPGADGVTGGRPLELDVTVGTGHVEVRRG